MLGRAVALRRSRSGLCLLLLCVAGPATASPDNDAAASAAELERVFKQRRPSTRAPVMLFVDHVEIASDEPILLDVAPANPSPLAPAAPLLAALTPRLRPDARPRLLAAVRDHRVSLDALRAVGLGVTYDPRRLELRIVVPPRLTVPVSHGLGARVAAEIAGALPPSDVSGYVNLRGGGGGAWSIDAPRGPRPPVHVHGDAAINVHGVVLEGSVDLARASPSAGRIAVHRGDVLLTRDVAADAVRYTAGDLGVPAAGLQASYPVLGVSVGRNFALQPYRVLRPIGSFDFTLDRPASVTVLVNGASVQTLRLLAGRHDIRDLPLGAGVNQIELLIKDDAGIERRITFAAASPDALLAPGVVQFSLGIGFLRTSDAGLRTYDFARPVVSGRRRWGVTSMLTVGGALDGDLAQQVGGAGLAVATRLGSLAVDGAASHEATAGVGAAVGARYDHSRTARGATRAVTLAAHHYSQGFRSFDSLGLVAGGRYHSDVALAVHGRLTPRLAGRFDLTYRAGRSVPDAQAFSLGISRSFGGLGVDASVSVLRHDATHDEARLFVTARWVLPGRLAAVHTASRASTATGTSNEITASRHSPTASGGLASSIRLSERPEAFGADASVGYTGPRFTAALAAGSAIDRAAGGSAQTASLEVATALAFAGGRFAWSRPITGSFALIDRHAVLDSTPVGVNPARGGYAAMADGFGPAVVPNLEPYRVGRITVEAPTLALGSSLGPGSYPLLPSYKSGTLVRVGEDGVVFVRGVLRDGAGAPVAFAVADLRSLDDPQRAPAVLLSNRSGRFGVTGLRPGRYQVRISGPPAAAADLVIPPGTTGVYATGVLVMK